jgi:hypothetical protein
MGSTFAAAEKPLHDVIDHSGDPTLATKASALLMNNLAATRRYEDAFKLVNDTHGHAMGRHRGRQSGRSLKPRVSGTMGSTGAKACSRPVLSSWPFRKSASCRCLYQTRRIHRCHDTSGCSLA